MSFLSSIGKAVGNFVKPISSILSPITSLINPVLPMIGGAMDYFGTRSQNAANAAQASTARDFNSAEADRQRIWAANEATTARNFNMSEAQKTRDYAERLSSSAYQRSANDLEKAGLNRILALGSPSSSPSGSTASGSAPSGASASGPTVRMENVFHRALDTVNSAVDVMKKSQEVDKIRAETSLIKPKLPTAQSKEAVAQEVLGIVKAAIKTGRDTHSAALKLKKSIDEHGVGWSEMYKYWKRQHPDAARFLKQAEKFFNSQPSRKNIRLSK